ncbi:hypothetical protein M758_4G269400 [Ceratodon purpureus]|nr:hypothetical protein M758_4G269400 [Ceratodon purpureus]
MTGHSLRTASLLRGPSLWNQPGEQPGEPRDENPFPRTGNGERRLGRRGRVPTRGERGEQSHPGLKDNKEEGTREEKRRQEKREEHACLLRPSSHPPLRHLPSLRPHISSRVPAAPSPPSSPLRSRPIDPSPASFRAPWRFLPVLEVAPSCCGSVEVGFGRLRRLLDLAEGCRASVASGQHVSVHVMGEFSCDQLQEGWISI